MNEETREALRGRLEEERTSLRQELVELGADPDRLGELGVELDEGFADSAHTTAERGRVLILVDRLRESLKEVDAAFRRLDAGTYGRCERCGKDIAPERLEALPYARLCLDCKQRAIR